MAPATIRGVRKSYGATQVIRGFGTAITDGAFVIPVGPSGYGKSTLPRMLAESDAPHRRPRAGAVGLAGTICGVLDERHDFRPGENIRVRQRGRPVHGFNADG